MDVYLDNSIQYMEMLNNSGCSYKMRKFLSELMEKNCEFNIDQSFTRIEIELCSRGN